MGLFISIQNKKTQKIKLINTKDLSLPEIWKIIKVYSISGNFVVSMKYIQE